jgi:hypothetical protein
MNTLGLDIGKKHLDACLIQDKQKHQRRVENTSTGVQTLLDW